MKHTFVSLAVSALISVSFSGNSALAQDSAGQWQVDHEKSSLTFIGDQQGKEFTGTFDTFDAVIRLDPDNLADAMIEATIDMSSVDAGNGERNDSLPTKDWFNVREYQTASFVSDTITATGDNAYEAAGTLTIKGVSQDVTLPFTLDIEGDTATAKGTLELTRTDYDVGTGAYKDGRWVGLTVTVDVDITATR